jgi:hypothetical protein
VAFDSLASFSLMNEVRNDVRWVETTVESSGLPCDPVYRQLDYTLGAVHTTSLTLANTIHGLIAHPEYIDLLLEEVKSE